jgi:hypothetical protein
MAADAMTRRHSALLDEKQLARFATEVGLEQCRLGSTSKPNKTTN